LLGNRYEKVEKYKLEDIIEFNPKETIQKGSIAKKIEMSQLIPFCRDVIGYTNEIFHSGTKFRNGDTIMARITPCLENGKTAKISLLNDNEIGFGSTEYIILRAKKEIADTDYIYYLATSSLVRECAIKSMGGSSGRQRVQLDVVKNLEISCPSYTEQQKIAKLLRLLDDKIELNRQINSNLEQQAQAIFKSWFIDFEPFGGTMPDDWQISTLSQVSKLRAGGDKPLKISNIKTKQYFYPVYSNGLANDGLYGYTDNAKILNESVTVSARGTIGFVCLRHTPFVPIVRLISVTPNSIITAKYVYCWLKHSCITGTGTTQQQLTVTDFGKKEIIVPSIDFVNHFTETMEPLFNRLWLTQDEIYILATIRDTLLPKLMSGEIDVSKIEID